MTSNSQFFDELSDDYDVMINFENALKNKTFFFKNFLLTNYKTALDLGCGTAADSIALSKLGLQVDAIDHSKGMLQQVFARPEVDNNIPADITKKLSKYVEGLEETIKNAKLLEFVSRSEVSAEFATRYYNLYGLTYDADDKLHTVPIYNYFLPAQAAHVIKTSLNLFQ